MSEVLVVAELSDSGVRKTTHSAISAARKINQLTGGSFSIIIVGGAAAKGAAAELAGYGASRILVCSDPSLTNYLAERYAPIVASQAKSFDVTLGTASSFGKDLLPRVAARLDAAYTADISDVLAEGGELTFKRPMYAGNAYGFCTLGTPQKIVSVRQSEFDPAEATGGQSPVADVPVTAPGAAAQRVEFVSLDQVKSERPELAEARVVVSGGRALKEQFFQVIEPLADALGAAIGASRAACDAGYQPHARQIGLTGKVITPKLYLAFGIDGAIQHLAGIRGSKVIVAINTKKDAPIFEAATYGCIADLFEFAPALTAELRRLREQA